MIFYWAGPGRTVGIFSRERYLVLLVGPCAFGSEGVKCALSTAGERRKPGVRAWKRGGGERRRKHGERKRGKRGRETDVGGQEGCPPLPLELREVQARDKADADRANIYAPQPKQMRYADTGGAILQQ